MKEFGEALKLIFSKIGDFFDIFDLSFFISGVVFVLAVYTWATLLGADLSTLFVGKIGIVIGILACYISGLICFASGRWIRTELFPLFSSKTKKASFDEQFLKILQAHGLDGEDPFSGYIKRKEHRGIWRLYIRLWADIRHSKSVESSLQLLRRYWVMTATYDGIAMSLFVWGMLSFSIALGLGDFPLVPQYCWVILGVTLFLVGVICLREAGRYVVYQVEELVASIASERNR